MIINPTQVMLDNAYKSHKLIANYLINNCGLEPIFIFDGHFYFARNCLLEQSLIRLPFLLKIFADY